MITLEEERPDLKSGSSWHGGADAHKAQLVFTRVLHQALRRGEHGVGETGNEQTHCPKVRAVGRLELLG